MALPSTNSVLSNMERINIFPNCGFLYGGNSKTKDEGIPFKMVLDSNFEIASVKNIPNIITKITAMVEITDAPKPCILPAINIVAIAIKNGNLPITGNKVIC